VTTTTVIHHQDAVTIEMLEGNKFWICQTTPEAHSCIVIVGHDNLRLLVEALQALLPTKETAA
jgi:hypothetical protein